MSLTQEETRNNCSDVETAATKCTLTSPKIQVDLVCMMVYLIGVLLVFFLQLCCCCAKYYHNITPSFEQDAGVYGSSQNQ